MGRLYFALWCHFKTLPLNDALMVALVLFRVGRISNLRKATSLILKEAACLKSTVTAENKDLEWDPDKRPSY